MAISDRINEMYTHVGDVYDTITNVDLPTNKNIQNISSTMRSSYLEIMNNGIDKIWNNWEKVNGTGTSLSLNSTEEAPMKIDLKGNTSQEGTPTPEAPQDIHVVSGDNEIVVNGKNFLDNTKIVKGRIDNGVIGYESGTTSLTTTSDSISFTTNANYRGVSTYYIELQNSVYFISNWQSADNTLAMTAHFYDKDKNYISQKGGYQSSSTSFRWANDVQNAKYVRITISLNSLGNVNVIKPQFQFVNDLNIPTYEPYQGNTYNIDLPVENLLQLPNGSKTTNGITATITDGKLKIVGTTTTNWFSICNLNIPLESGTYIFSYTNKKVNRYNFNIKYADNTTQVIYGNAYSNTPITLNQNATITGMFSDNNATGATFDYEDYLMLEKGTKANSYTPYGTTPIELCKIGDYQDRIFKSSGKNLFDKDSISNGFLDENGIVGGDTSAYRTSDFIPILPNTAYYKTTTSSPRTKYYDKNKHPLNTTTYWDIPIGGNAGTFTTPSTAYYFRFSYPVTGVNANGIMINKGQTALPYEPYGKVWYLNKQIGKVVLNGSENWNADAGTQGTDYRHNILRSRLDIPNPIGINGTYMSNYFRQHTMNNDVGVFGEFYCNSNWFIFLDKEKQYLIEGWKDWLSTHNTIVYYVLATPTYTEITDSALLSQLEALNGAKSYTTQTNISQENNDLPFILDATALKQLTQ